MMFFQVGSFDPIRLLETMAGSGAIVWGVLHQDRKARKKEAEAAEVKRQEELKALALISQERHEENKGSLDDIKTRLEYHPPHAHIESGNDPLTPRGIQYGPRNRR